MLHEEFTTETPMGQVLKRVIWSFFLFVNDNNCFRPELIILDHGFGGGCDG